LLPSKDDAIKEVNDYQNEVIFSEIKDQNIKEETNNNYIQNNTGIKIIFYNSNYFIFFFLH
jgi:hypothetical protein